MNRKTIMILGIILIVIIALGLQTSVAKPPESSRENGAWTGSIASSSLVSSEDSDKTGVIPDNPKSKSKKPVSESGMALEALKGAEITDLYIIYGDAALSLADRVKIKAYYINGSKKYTRVYKDVAIQNGASAIPLTDLDMHETVDVEVVIGKGKSKIEMSGETTVKLRPDISIQSINAPATVFSTSAFNANITVIELNKDTGANFTVVIKEGTNILSSRDAGIAAGGSVTVSIPLLIAQVGMHNLSAVIENSNPAENNIGNNRQNFTVEIVMPLLNQADYTTMYYSQDDDYHNSKNLNSADGGGTHIEVSDYTEKRTVEKFYYKLTLNKELIFPIDFLHIQVSNDSGIVEEHEYANLKNETVYYPDTESTLTITSAGGLTEIKLERSAKYQETVSSGYNYYSASENTSWNTGFIYQKGVLMNPRIKTGVYIELIDGGAGYGGLGTMNLTAPVYSSSTWNNVGVTGYRNITTDYTKQAGRTSI